jgi:uncharacterized GH25 family protein
MNRTIKLTTLALAACVPLMAQAHKAWLLPSATVSTVDQWVTVDAAVSNNLFYFDHVPLRVEALEITAPNGTVVKPENVATGKYRTTFDLHLEQSGTYRLANINSGVFASYEEDGKTKRWRGTAEKFATEVPANAKNLQVNQSNGRVETFVTAGKPTTDALKPTNVGLELVPVTHPNDLYAGEAAKFGMLLDGKPAANLEVTVIPGGTRYRDQQDEIKVTTDAKGQFSVTWPEPGMYWLETGLQDANTSIKQAKQRRVSYIATVEVLPQ